MKDILEQKKDPCTYLGNLNSNYQKKTWKIIQAWTGFEPMTSAMPVQCSTNWACWELVKLVSS